MNDTNGGGGIVGEVSDVMSEKGQVLSAGSTVRHGKKASSQGGVQTKAHQLYNRWILEFLLQRKELPPSKDGRHIPLDITRKKTLVDERRGHAYVSNAIRTARYNVIDFFPKQLWFQFTRLGNFYFLCVGIPQTIPGLSTTGNVTTILPLMFFVLLTIVKEGYDDYKRHRLDKVENATRTTVLKRAGHGPELGRSRSLQLGFKHPRNTAAAIHDENDGSEAFGPFYWAKTEWSRLKVGDIVKLGRDDDVPADIILLHADGEDGMAYIETMALDGETNLKSKQVSPALKGCNSIEGISSCAAEFVVEDPNADLYKFDGRVTVDGKTSPLTLNEIIYRGSTVRNTNNVVGIVINTGEECKIRMNANRHPRAKKPALEAVYNRIVLSLVVYVLALTAGCSVGYMLWQNRTEKDAWYLTGAAVPAEEIIVGFAIQFNNVIPLALYVSLEIVKIGQLLMLNSDIEMYDEASDTPARCNTNTILENLGQVGYVFSDKTGTLTENIMKFRKISIAGTSWLHEADVQDKEASPVPYNSQDTPKEKEPSRSKSLDITRIVPEAVQRISFQGDTPPSPSIARRSSSHWRSSARPDHVQPELTTTDLLEFVRQRPNSPFSRRAIQFILAVALCHTVLPETRDGNIEFQASSPDELALVEAARDLGFLVVHRSAQQVTLQISNADGTTTLRTYEILDVIEFSSKRKRMSIIVRCPDGRIWLLSKGADSMILPRLKLAHLAIQKANEVRQSVEIERALQRRSEQFEPRNSFGGRPSLNIRRSLAVDGQVRRSLVLDNQAIAGPSNTRPSMTSRSKSFEVGKMTRSEDRPRPPLITRNTSHLSHSGMPHSPRATEHSSEKFSFLDDPAVSDDSAIFSRCFKHLDEFATEGLRTLLFAHKYISESEYQTWKKVFHDATTSLIDRQDRIEEAGELIEQNLDLVGASAIEDKLQDGVPETIEKLRKANIKIWMLTGDKRETAINIAHSARLCRPGSDIFILDVAKGDLEEQLLGIREELEVTSSGSILSRHTVVVVDGHTLGAIENPVDPSASNPHLKRLFFSLIPTIDSVICCRASPAQKALLVRAIRRANPSHTAPLTLAIGDGANDLAMISEAHVGVGISGREGLQAARVADYSIAQFRFLQRLLLVHGRWNYTRTAKFILCTFWKEMFFYIPTEIFSRYTGFTGTSLYEMWSLTVLNTLFTSLAVILPGIWEKDLSAETLLAVPELYVYGQYHKGLNPTKFLGWMIAAGVEGVLVFFGCWAGFGLFGQLGAHSDNGLFVLGNLVFSVCIMWTNWKLMIIETHHKSVVILAGFAITVVGWWLWQCFLAGIYAKQPSPYAVRDGFFLRFGKDPVWWLTLLVVLFVLVCIELGYKVAKRTLIIMGLWKWRWSWLWRIGGWCRWRKGQEKELNRSLEEWDLELWQEMEQDPVVKERLKAILRNEEDGAEDDVDGNVAVIELGVVEGESEGDGDGKSRTP